MANVAVFNMEGKEVGTLDLSDAVFGVEVNEHLVHMAVVWQLANKRQGTQKAKTRSEVSGGGRKPWRQKGTGHARQGSTRAPQWTGGGVVFAPVPRDYSFKMNKKEKRAALKSALSSRVEENKFIVVDEMNFDEIKTKKFQNVLNNLNVNKALVVLEDGNTNAEISARNIAGVKTARTNTINVYDILKYNTVIATKAAVATIEEGITLRRHKIAGEILILGYTAPCRAADLQRFRLRQTVVDMAHAEALNAIGIPLEVEIKVDTGMHRLGIDVQNVHEIEKVYEMNCLKICGIYSHLCVSDGTTEEEIDYTKKQISLFYQLIQKLGEKKIKIPCMHLQSSYGLLNYPQLPCDYVRMGIALYGTLSAKADQVRKEVSLYPVMEIKSRITSVRTLRAGETAGYGRKFLAQTDRKIATVSIGYGDGIPRNLSDSHMEVLIQGKRVPVVGRICMDQMLVDVTSLQSVSAGDLVTVVGKDGEEEILITELAEKAGTITNELLSRIGCRMPKVYSK
mgnify:CR=1 FL=1